MSVKTATVALKLSKLSVHEKILRCGVITTSVTANPALFSGLAGQVAVINSAISNLQIAVKDAADGGKTKNIIMRDKERELVKLMTVLAHEVEKIANGDEEIIHKASMYVKATGKGKRPDFEIYQEEPNGTVNLRTKPQSKTVYRWEYNLTGNPEDVWTPGVYTDVAHAIIGNLEVNKTYWFRVVYISKLGEYPTLPISLAVK